MAGKLTLTVSQLSEYIRRMFQLDPMLHNVELRGEISNLKFHQTGSLFFTLKDEQAAIGCVMYASDAMKLSCTPFDGMRAVITGSVGLYVKGGQMQFYAHALRAEGVGVLYERLLQLKERLGAEGLFAKERKRPLPAFPDTIGVVSSPTGAVIHDIIHVATRRDPQARILLCPVRVQGIGAADEVVGAIRLLEQIDSVSVIIVARGGGSMEDLWTFNEERVVRAVAACTKPVISAVGHETDVTLCDLAADFRAPTPSAAAECAVPRRDELEASLRAMKEALLGAAREKLIKSENALALRRARLQAYSPEASLARAGLRLEQAKHALKKQMDLQLSRREALLAQHARALDMLSPLRVLSRGYAVVMKNGAAVSAGMQLAQGDEVSLRFASGSAQARIICVSAQEDV